MEIKELEKLVSLLQRKYPNFESIDRETDVNKYNYNVRIEHELTEEEFTFLKTFINNKIKY